MKRVTLVLFDIDGTLLHTHGAGRRAFARAVQAVFGADDDLSYIRFAGNTDLDVLQDVLDRHGIEPSAEQVEAFFPELGRQLEKTVRDTQLTIYPGVRELLDVLIEQPGILLGLVTGNIASCARIKLSLFNLHDHFELGAFGHEHGDRGEIARLAIQRAHQHLEPGQEIARYFLIGDTPADVLAAKAVNATSIAVATGSYDAEALRRAGADFVLNDLGHLEGVLKLLGIDPT